MVLLLIHCFSLFPGILYSYSSTFQRHPHHLLHAPLCSHSLATVPDPIQYMVVDWLRFAIVLLSGWAVISSSATVTSLDETRKCSKEFQKGVLVTTVKLRLKCEPVPVSDKTEEEIISKELRANGKQKARLVCFCEQPGPAFCLNLFLSVSISQRLKLKCTHFNDFTGFSTFKDLNILCYGLISHESPRHSNQSD